MQSYHLKKVAKWVNGLSEFNELIRNFDKIRVYMRDFYIYGFKSRNDFKHKSPRTYDNEKRRIESYLGEYMKWSYTKSGKTAFISMDCAKVCVNPLYAAWKSKAFTANDIMLHFYILDVLREGLALSVEQLTNAVSEQCEQVFDVQTVRLKCTEYLKAGLLTAKKDGKMLLYRLSDLYFKSLSERVPGLIEAVKFFQGAAAFGEIGSHMMDQEQTANDTFVFKHYYVAHTLESGILLQLLTAIRENRAVEFENYCEKTQRLGIIFGIPLKIFVSTATGRRYVCVYRTETRRYFSYRLDHIMSLKLLEVCDEVSLYKSKLEKNIDKVWGVCFGGRNRNQLVCMKLFIDEKKEGYIMERIRREGHGGELLHLDKNIFLYTKELFDLNDISPWIKTFMGRIIQLEGTNSTVINRFYNDIKRMKDLYDI